jgi:hypothetical protein
MSKLMAIGEIVDMQHHPWGNQYLPTSACGSGPYYDADNRHCFDQRCGKSNPPSDCYAAPLSQLICQHGSQECAFNRLQACAKDFTVEAGEAWQSRYWPFVKCVEDGYSQGVSVATQCASSSGFNGTETEYLNTCLETSAGDKSVLREAMATPDHAGTPTVLVNGQRSSPNSALRDVCAAYTGPRPAGCAGVVEADTTLDQIVDETSCK